RVEALGAASDEQAGSSRCGHARRPSASRPDPQGSAEERRPKTIEANLQTLCDRCNLGKSNVLWVEDGRSFACQILPISLASSHDRDEHLPARVPKGVH